MEASSIEISVDESVLGSPEATAPRAIKPILTVDTWDFDEAASSSTPAVYGTILLDDVHSPSTPHPFTMSPPPPPGEPPRLLRNKRPHGLFYTSSGPEASLSPPGAGGTPAASPCPSVMASCSSTAMASELSPCANVVAGDVIGVGAPKHTGDVVVNESKMDISQGTVVSEARARSPASGRSSPSSPSSSSSSSSEHDNGNGGAVGSAHSSLLCSSQMCDSPRDVTMCTSAQKAAPQCPVAEMHVSPRDDLMQEQSPSQEAEASAANASPHSGRPSAPSGGLVAGQDEPEMPPGPPPAKMAPPPPFGPPPSLPLDRAELKRGVEEPASSPLGKRLRSFGPASETRPGCSSDGESSSSTSDAEDAREEDPGRSTGRRRPGQGEKQSSDDVLEESYAQSPPAARWVWDRFLQQDGGLASAVTLEKRMLLALDALHVGATAESS